MTHWLRASIALAEDPHPIFPALTLGGSEPPVTPASGALTQVSKGTTLMCKHIGIYTHMHSVYTCEYT